MSLSGHLDLVILWCDLVIVMVILVILCCNGVVVTVIFLYITAIVGHFGSFDWITREHKTQVGMDVLVSQYCNIKGWEGAHRIGKTKG